MCVFVGKKSTVLKKVFHNIQTVRSLGAMDFIAVFETVRIPLNVKRNEGTD